MRRADGRIRVLNPRWGFVDGMKFSFGRGVWSNINPFIFRDMGNVMVDLFGWDRIMPCLC